MSIWYSGIGYKIVEVIDSSTQPIVSSGRWVADASLFNGLYSMGDIVTNLPDTPEIVENFQNIMSAQVNDIISVWRNQYITSISGQESIYTMKGDEALSYMNIINANQTPVDTNYPLLSTEAQCTNSTLDSVAKLVYNLAVQWKQLAAFSEGQRRGALVSIQNATTISSLNTVLLNLMNNLYPPTTLPPTTTLAP